MLSTAAVAPDSPVRLRKASQGRTQHLWGLPLLCCKLTHTAETKCLNARRRRDDSLVTGRSVFRAHLYFVGQQRVLKERPLVRQHGDGHPGTLTTRGARWTWATVNAARGPDQNYGVALLCRDIFCGAWKRSACLAVCVIRQNFLCPLERGAPEGASPGTYCRLIEVHIMVHGS